MMKSGFYRGVQQWRCAVKQWEYEQTRKAQKAINNARNNPRMVRGASGYLGMAPTAEQAQYLNGLGKEFRDRQQS
jgi:hypothetical protein